MKLKFINKEGIKRLGKRAASILTLSAALVSPLALSDSVNAYASEDVTITSDVNSDNQGYTYTQEAWDEFEENAWNSIAGKINNANRDEFNAALKIFNIEYLDVNNPQILIDYYSKGIDAENELNKAYNVLSQIREYNTTVAADDVYFVGNLLVSQKDRAILTTLNSYLKEVKNSETPIERVEEIFNLVNDFSQGKGKIAVVIADQIVEVAQLELSKGGVVLSENIMQSISVECQEMISEERRAELDESLRTKDVLAGIQEIMIRNNAIASVTTPQVSEKLTEDIVAQVEYMREYIAKEVEPMGVTREESDALHTVANIDFFVDSTNSANAFQRIYAEGFDINKTFADAEAAVEKIENYNLTAENIYDYGHYFIESKTDIISTKAIANLVHFLRSDDPATVEQSIQSLKGYTQYSSLVTVNYQEYDDNGNVGEVQKLDKNALNKGGNQVIDWITYYAFLNNKTIINNDQLVSDMIALVDGTTYGFTPYDDIVLMITEYCAENNIAMFDYTVGGNQKNYE